MPKDGRIIGEITLRFAYQIVGAELPRDGCEIFCVLAQTLREA